MSDNRIKDVFAELADSAIHALTKATNRLDAIALVSRRDKLKKSLGETLDAITEAALHDLLEGDYPDAIAERYGISVTELEAWRDAQDDEWESERQENAAKRDAGE